MTGPASRAHVGAGGRIRSAHVPNPFAVPYLVALERGFFADEGLELEDTRVSNGSVIAEALGKDELDVGTGGHLQTAAAVAAGSDQAFIAPLGFERAPDHLCIVLVARRDRARSLADLAGRAVAVSAQGAISELQLRIALGGAAVRTIAMPFSRMGAALADGDVDAASIVEPFASALANDASLAVLDRGSLSRALGPGERALVVGLVARRAWIAAHPELARAIARAVRRASAVLRADDGLARSTIARVTGVPAEDATLPLFDDEIRASDLQPTNDLARSHGLLPRRIDARELIAEL
jgi:NitT/TauT family transport system substrate-binding protein